jgi:hypothetical protein
MEYFFGLQGNAIMCRKKSTIRPVANSPKKVKVKCHKKGLVDHVGKLKMSDQPPGLG